MDLGVAKRASSVMLLALELGAKSAASAVPATSAAIASVRPTHTHYYLSILLQFFKICFLFVFY